MKNKLTVIITFLNEGIEIANTLSSIRSTGGNTIDILLINDCSTDNTDYESYALEYNTRYHKNKERMGVAASRDLAVSMISTPYFLLLDGHMRFYDDRWVSRIIEELKSDEKLLLCCKTRVLQKNNDQIFTYESNMFGAYINLVEEENLLNLGWNHFESNPNDKVEDIPCVLGAAYACSREYWDYLKGLSGLMYYGSDEAYISLKVWLSGGKCRLLKDVAVGHLYRRVSPYKTENVYTLYNDLLIAELLFPKHLRDIHFSQSALKMGEIFVSANYMLKQRKNEILELKRYYHSIFVADFGLVYHWSLNILQRHNELGLKKLANSLMKNSNKIEDSGLLYGKMGIVIFFAHYAQYTGLEYYDDFAETLLNEIYDTLGKNSSIALDSGLCGIGWGIEYLIQNGFREGNTDEILEAIDKKIADLDIENINNMTLENGLYGIIHYIYARIVSSHSNKRNIPYKKDFLERIVNRTKKDILEKHETEFSIIISSILSFINDGSLSKKSITLKDIIELPHYFDEWDKNPSLGLRSGYAGVGLNKMRIK